MDILTTEIGIEAENNPSQVNSGNLVDFLSGVSKGKIVPDLDKESFSPELRLPWVKEYISEMYRNQKRGRYLPKEAGEKLQEKAEEVRDILSANNVQEPVDKLSQMANQEGLLEAARNVSST